MCTAIYLVSFIPFNTSITIHQLDYSIRFICALWVNEKHQRRTITVVQPMAMNFFLCIYKERIKNITTIVIYCSSSGSWKNNNNNGTREYGWKKKKWRAVKMNARKELRYDVEKQRKKKYLTKKHCFYNTTAVFIVQLSGKYGLWR